jgi:hypothetical protein
MRLVKTNNKEFFRDEHNNALINTNASAYKQYKIYRENRNTINDLKSEIKELKEIIRGMVK